MRGFVSQNRTQEIRENKNKIKAKQHNTTQHNTTQHKANQNQTKLN
jgi:hypothetical protein